MTKLRLTLVTGALLALAVPLATTASAELSPWEKFCLINAKPGQDTANCLNGLPSRGGKGKTVLTQDSLLPGISVPLPPPSATGSPGKPNMPGTSGRIR